MISIKLKKIMHNPDRINVSIVNNSEVKTSYDLNLSFPEFEEFVKSVKWIDKKFKEHMKANHDQHSGSR
jgi:hypothetical protein